MGMFSRLAGAVLGAMIVAGCERVPKPPPARPAPLTYQVRGVLKKVVDAKTGRAVIAHEDIAGYMPAMTMEFQAARPAELAGFVPGDVLTFRLVVSDASSAIEQVRKVGHAEVPVETPAVSGLPVYGTPLPEVRLTDQRGQPVRLADYKGRALAITFIFTRCPLPDFCPRMSQQFGAVQRELSKIGGDWQLLSVTIDPAYDQPAVLAEYAQSYAADPARWTFATGEVAEIRKLGEIFGLASTGASPALEHNLRTVVVDPAGRVQKVFPGNDWQAADLVAEMKRAMSGK
jgi:protein SCO1/2